MQDYLRFQYSGSVSALKNNRQGFKVQKPKNLVDVNKPYYSYNQVQQYVNMAQISPPSKEVKKDMEKIQASFRRQMGDRPIIEKPKWVYCYCELGLYWGEYPVSDLDNKWTTVQECMQGIIVQNDVQIRSFTPLTWKTATGTSEYFDLWVFPFKDIRELSLEYLVDVHKFILDKI